MPLESLPLSGSLSKRRRHMKNLSLGGISSFQTFFLIQGSLWWNPAEFFLSWISKFQHGSESFSNNYVDDRKPFTNRLEIYSYFTEIDNSKLSHCGISVTQGLFHYRSITIFFTTRYMIWGVSTIRSMNWAFFLYWINKDFWLFWFVSHLFLHWPKVIFFSIGPMIPEFTACPLGVLRVGLRGGSD